MNASQKAIAMNPLGLTRSTTAGWFLRLLIPLCLLSARMILVFHHHGLVVDTTTDTKGRWGPTDDWGNPPVQVSEKKSPSRTLHSPSANNNSSCAILFVGLPRSYRSLVLPSIVRNVLPYNPNCDYFVHSYNKTHEAAGRGGIGGAIDPTELFSLRDAVAGQQASVHFFLETEEEFEKARASELHKLWNETDESGRLLYQVHRGHFTNTSMLNVMKQWHSISAAWSFMERAERARGSVNYTTVAVLRSDVVFVTPIQVENQNDKRENNNALTVPGFALWPQNDRLALGARPAVQMWADRWSLLDAHVRNHTSGIHPEKYLHKTIFPAIRQAGYAIERHETMCFLRARPRNVLWANDCYDGSLLRGSTTRAIEKEYGKKNMQVLVENTLGRPCAGPTLEWTNTQKELYCPISSSNSSESQKALLVAEKGRNPKRYFQLQRAQRESERSSGQKRKK